jgi:hypothetical protein
MGNSQRHQQEEGDGEDKNMNYPGIETTWLDFQKRRASPYFEPKDDDDNAVNGFIFNNVLIPDSLVELILTFVRPEDILNCNLVS